jgi:hypothetical protein
MIMRKGYSNVGFDFRAGRVNHSQSTQTRCVSLSLLCICFLSTPLSPFLSITPSPISTTSQILNHMEL